MDEELKQLILYSLSGAFIFYLGFYLGGGQCLP